MRAQRGFSIVEVLFALAFFLVGLYGIVGLQMAVYSGARKSSDVAMATSLVGGLLEELYVSDIDTLRAQEDHRRFFNQYGLEVEEDDALYTIDWQATVPNLTFYEVTATATWLNPGEEARVSERWAGHQVRMKTNILRKYLAP